MNPVRGLCTRTGRGVFRWNVLSCRRARIKGVVTFVFCRVEVQVVLNNPCGNGKQGVEHVV